MISQRFLIFLFIVLMCPVGSWAADTKTEKDEVLPVLKPVAAQELIVREQETQELPDDLQKYMKKKKIDPEGVSIFVRDVNAADPLLDYKADELRNPASTMKILTTWSAMKVLGPSWSWDTEAWLRGELEGDVLQGDLILKGYGDPFLVYETFWQFVQSLRLRGIREITGDIIIDDSFFEVPEMDRAAFDNKPTRPYNAEPSALMFNFQSSRFLLTPDPDNERVGVNILPPLPDASVDNQLQLVKGRCSKGNARPVILPQKNGTLAIRGKLADECGQRELHRLVSSPRQHVFNAFKSVWGSLGGEIGGGFKVGTVRKGDHRFFVHTSRPLADQVRLINKWSNNVMTRQMLLSLGAKQYGAPGTLEKGRLAIMDVLREQGVSTEGIVIENGSGLSREARVSAAQLGALLQAIWHDPYMPEMLNSLPLLGQDGTLARRFRKTEQAGRSRFKTGTLNRVTALAGYMLTRSGKRMVIVVQHNGRRAGSAGRGLQNKLLEWVFEQ